MTHSSVQQLEIVQGEELSPAFGRVLSLPASAWEKVRAWVRRRLTTETITEMILVTVVMSFVGWFFFSLHHALRTLTIVFRT